jgi:hypothetical protein
MGHYEQRVGPTNTRLLMRQITCCIVRTMGTLTHSSFFINSEKLPAGLPHTFTDRRDAIIEGEEELIVDVIENCGDMAYQL